MAKQRTGPFTEEHLKTLDKVLKACAESAAYFAKCEACGLDVGKEAKANAEQAETARRMKAQFFPNHK